MPDSRCPKDGNTGRELKTLLIWYDSYAILFKAVTRKFHLEKTDNFFMKLHKYACAGFILLCLLHFSLVLPLLKALMLFMHQLSKLYAKTAKENGFYLIEAAEEEIGNFIEKNCNTKYIML